MFRAALLFLQLLSVDAFAEIKRDHVQVRLIASPAATKDTLQLGVHFKIDPEWHVYWKNPGDSGAAPKFHFTGGKLLSVGWPYPIRLPVGHLTNYGYEHEVVFFLKVAPEQKQMKLGLEWLVCKIECIPGFGEFTFTREDLAIDRALIAKFQARTPTETEMWKTEFVGRNKDALEFKLASTQLKPQQIKNLFVFPENGEMFRTTLPKIDALADEFRISVPLSDNASLVQKEEAFTFVVHDLKGEAHSFTKTIPPQKPTGDFAMGLLLAFLGGAVLNLMPCVFPVLFLKAFGFLKEPDSRKIKRSSWAYSAGVVVSFFAIGAVLTALRYGGEAVGWGFQLQNPLIVYSLALLFFLMALNFYGYFEFGDTVAGFAGRLGAWKLFSGSFGTGVLAVVVASPCTAPFMGSALGLTLLLPAHQSLLIFVSLGAGMALPMLLLGHMPGLILKLPRSGQWMIVVKQFLSFPLLATCLWLLWVLANQKGSDAVFIALFSFLLVTHGIWLRHSSSRLLFRVSAVMIVFLAPLATFYFLAKISTPSNGAQVRSSAWSAYDEFAISEKRRTQPVFIDFTASWCITCQVNKRAVLDTDEIQSIFKKQGVYLVRADWTNHDPVITKALARFNRNSVPFYVYFNKIAEARTLPELLTKDMVKELFEGGRQ